MDVNPSRAGSVHGVTKSERYLSRICKETFLSLWSYPNLFRDQGKQTAKSDGKELSDLFVVFGNHIIIFSDKHCKYPNSGNEAIDWCRWYRRAVLESVKQLSGAKRWLTQYPNRIFLDRGCTKPLPIALPDPKNAQIHLVAVANGATDACRKYFQGGRGSLVIALGHPVPVSTKDGTSTAKPFFVGQPDPDLGLVHIIDEVALDIVLRELDTVQDFLDYLILKESLVSRGRTVVAAGEEELLAWYIEHRYLGNDNIIDKFKSYNFIAIDVGFWDELVASPQYAAKKDRDRVSYAIDGLIEDFTRYLKSGTLRSAGKHEEVEKILRILASRTRFERRVLAQCLIDVLQDANGRGVAITRSITPFDRKDIGYILLAMPKFVDEDEAEYRERREFYAGFYAQVYGLNNPLCKTVISIGTEPGLDGPRSTDLVCFDNTDWPDGKKEEIRKLQDEFGVYKNHKSSQKHFRPLEFPKVGPGFAGRVGRNAPCPCGSGKKHKKCCL